MLNTKFLDKFIIQSFSNNLKTKGLYPSRIMDQEIKVSFGMGTPTHIPWISFLGPGMSTSNGFFPVYLFYKKTNILILSYGVSETIKPPKVWSNEIINSSTKISSYLHKPFRYGDSFIFKSYVPKIIGKSVNYFIDDKKVSHSDISNHLIDIITTYKKCLNTASNEQNIFEKNVKKTFIGSLIGIFKSQDKNQFGDIFKIENLPTKTLINNSEKLKNRLQDFDDVEFLKTQRKNNLDAGRPVNHGFPTTLEENELLKKKFLSNSELPNLSKFFGRTEYAIKVRLTQMGLINENVSLSTNDSQDRIEEEKKEKEKYSGETKNGDPHGFGTYEFSNGDKYVGQFKNGDLNGHGIYTWESGEIYEGAWKDGEQNGKGRYTFQNDEMYEGEWKDGKRHGYGINKHSDGKVQDGEWVNDQFVIEKEKKLDIASSENNHEIISNTIQNQNERRLANLPKIKNLQNMAYMGIDKALMCLYLQNHKVAVKKVFKGVQNFRPRYKEKSINNINSNLYLESFRTINPILMSYPFKFFIKPIGKGKFLYLQENIDRTVLVSEIIKLINGQQELPDWSLNVSDFKNQAISSLIFHSQIVNDSSANKEEYDILDYVFDEKFSRKIYSNLFSRLKISNQTDFIHYVEYSDLLIGALDNLTIDLIQNLKNWQNLSFDQIYQLVSEAPRRFKVSKARITLENEEFPEELLKLSVFVLSSFTTNSNLIKKIGLLHRYGLRRIKDLILFHKPFRALFKDPNLLKKIKLLDYVKSL